MRAGQPITATVTVRDDGPGTEDEFADPRLSGRGAKVDGTLYVDDFGIRRFTGNEQASLRYSYRIT